jgi:pectate lyase
LREAVSAPGRLVVFDLSGIIRLKQNIELSSDLTIAGESSPNEGISLYGAGVSVTGKSNIILRFLHFRSGISSDRGKKALGIDRSDHIVVDHCSIEWGRWDDLGITVGSHDITIQYCLVAEAIHPQSFGALIDTVTNVTLSHNLWMSNESRNPKAKGTIQYINNVVYNWAITGLCGGHSGGIHLLDVIGNYFVKGPSSNDNFAGQFLATDHVYQSGNYVDLDRDGKLTGRLAANGDFHEVGEGRYTLPTFVESPSMHPSVPVTIQLAAEAFATVIAEAGCSLHRDSVDRRLIAEASSLGTKGSTLAHTDARGEALSGGLETIEAGKAPVDSDHDGIPDEWELAHHLDPANPADAAALGATGYTHLEEYWHDLVRNQGSHQPRAKQ